MTGGLDTLFVATVTFVGAHFLLSSAAIRTPVIDRFGEKLFQLAYSLIVTIAFIWMLLAWGDAEFELLWDVPAFDWLAVVLMPVALFLAVGAFSTPSPTMAGKDAIADGDDPTRGIVRITRHPFLNGVILWAVSHILANGDTASLIMFGGLMVLAAGGMWHIDKKKEAHHGPDWGPVLLTTSAVPFLALMQKRTTFDWPGIGWSRLAATIVVYVLILLGHPLLLGVSAWPG